MKQNIKLKFEIDTMWGIDGIVCALKTLAVNIEHGVYTVGSEWRGNGSGFNEQGKISSNEQASTD